MQRFLYYLLVIVVSYTTGMVLYISLFQFVYGENINGEIRKVIIWTAPSYLCIVIPSYLAIHFMLRNLRCYVFFQSIAFIIIGVIPTYMSAVMMGYGAFVTADFFISPEAVPFYVFFTGTALVFSCGCQLDMKRKAKAAIKSSRITFK